MANALLDGEEVTTCPFIWVDRDFALARGWLQGFPKKLGEVWITRDFGLGGPADPGAGRGRAPRRHLRAPTAADWPRPRSPSRDRRATAGRTTTRRRS